MADPAALLEAATTIAVVGMSTDPGKASHAVPVALRDAGFRVIPVHPKARVIAGERVYADLEEITDPVDLVEVFRPAEEAPAIARQAAAINAGGLWLQVGIASEEAGRIAAEAGMDFVEDTCMHEVLMAHDIHVG